MGKVKSKDVTPWVLPHEYSKEELEALFAEVMRFTPRLYAMTENIFAYCERFGIRHGRN